MDTWSTRSSLPLPIDEPDSRRPSRSSVGGLEPLFRKSGTSSLSMDKCLSWHDVDYFINIKGKKNTQKQILHNITGTVRCGEMLAIMGTSGSGKTSFLNVLSGRHLDGVVCGSILINGKNRTASFSSYSVYIEQNDFLLACLTVRETFEIQALLRLPSEMSHAEKRRRALETSTLLGLSACLDTRVGNGEVRGISGGERRRVSIGIELITNPDIIFLDEPTSGLDSFTAFQLIQTVRDIAHGGCSVVCTIHQPRANIFLLFDKLLLLSLGRMIFYGPVSDAESFFDANNFPVPKNTNAADHYLDITTVNTRNDHAAASSKAQVDHLYQSYISSPYYASALRETHPYLEAQYVARRGSEGRPRPQSWGPRHSLSSVSSRVQEPVDERTHWPVSWPAQVGILYKRAFTSAQRDPLFVKSLIGQAFGISIFVGLIFLRVGTDQRSVQDRYGAIFFLTSFCYFVSLTCSLEYFHKDKGVFLRERASKTFQVSAFYVAKILADLPVYFIFTLILTVICYFMFGLQEEASRFFKTLLVAVTSSMTGEALSVIVSILAPSYQVAMLAGPGVLTVLMLVAGFFSNIDAMWVGITPLRYITPVRYTYSSLCLNEFHGLAFSDCPPLSNQSCYSNGEQCLEAIGFAQYTFWEEYAKLIAIFIGVRILGYLLLRFRNRAMVILATKPKNRSRLSVSV